MHGLNFILMTNIKQDKNTRHLTSLAQKDVTDMNTDIATAVNILMLIQYQIYSEINLSYLACVLTDLLYVVVDIESPLYLSTTRPDNFLLFLFQTSLNHNLNVGLHYA